MVDARHGWWYSGVGITTAAAAAGVGDGCVDEVGVVCKGPYDSGVGGDDIGGANVGRGCDGKIRTAW